MKNSIDITQGQEGSSFDPYAVETIYFTDMHGTEFELRMGLGVEFSVNGNLISKSNFFLNEDLVVAEWEEATGLTLQLAQKLYHKHFYFEDPMGSPGMYI